MAVLRSALEARVAGILIDDNADAAARIVPEIKKAQSDLEEMSYKFIVQETQVQPNPTVGVGVPILQATMPTDWIEPHGRSFLLDPTGPTKGADLPPLDWVEPDEETVKVYPHSLMNPNPSLRGQPEALFHWPMLDQIWVLPVPDATYTIWLKYYKRLATLGAAGTSNWWTTHLEDYLVFRAAARVLNFNRDPEYIKYEIMAKGEYLRAKRADKRRRFRKQHGRIRPRRDVRAAYTQRRM